MRILILLLSLFVRFKASADSEIKNSLSEIEKILFENGDVDLACNKVKGPIDRHDMLLRYFIESVFYNNHEEALFFLYSSDHPLTQLATSARGRGAYSIIISTEQHARMYLDMATPVFETYEYDYSKLKPKQLFEVIHENKSLYKTMQHVVNLIRSGDKRAEEFLIKAIKEKRIDASKYLPLVRRIAERGNGQAMGILGDAYFYGNGVSRSFSAAMHYYSEGAKRRDPSCYDGLGRINILEDYLDLSMARKYFEKASRMGMASADYNLYKLYKDHYKMYDVANIYLSMSARKGYLPALYQHGKALFEKENYEDAIRFLLPVCYQCKELCDIEDRATKFFEEGKYSQSLICLLWAAELGSSEAMKNTLYLLRKHPGIIKGSDKIYFKVATDLMDQNDNTVCVTVGNCYYWGIGTEKSYKDAYAFYLAGALSGDAEGFYSLAYMHEYGLGCNKDYMKSLGYLFDMSNSNENAYLVFWYCTIKIVFKIIFECMYYMRYIIIGLLSLGFISWISLKRML